MKKYVKPDLVYENFELSHSVASGCGTALNHSKFTCTIEGINYGFEPGETIFMSGTGSACIIDSSDAGLEIYCQQTGNDGVFTS